jgi:hypothetical protein
MVPTPPLDTGPGLPGDLQHAALTSLRHPLTLWLAVIALSAALVWGGDYVQSRLLEPAVALPGALASGGDGSVGTARPKSEWIGVVVQLAAAALIGLLVTSVHRHVRRDRALSRAMEQAQTLLCVSGALMMIIIGNSLARAFGIAGAAAIIRFRTPVDDPTDATILFLLLALGMAAGIGALPLAGLGTLCLCALLPVLERFSPAPPRTMAVELVARGPEFPSARVQEVFARNAVTVEPREIGNGELARIKYLATIGPGVELEDLSRQLLDGDVGIGSLSWETKKRA